jgi:hypothetical protein
MSTSSDNKLKIVNQYFDPKKYSDSIEMSLYEWWLALTIRRWCLYGYSNGHQPNPTYAESLLKDIINDPTNRVARKYRNEEELDRNQRLNVESSEISSATAVLDLSMFSMWRQKLLIDNLFPENKTIFTEWHNVIESNYSNGHINWDDENDCPRRTPMETELSYHDEILKKEDINKELYDWGFISVDLGASDELILESFKTWLGEKRASMTSHNKYIEKKQGKHKNKKEHIFTSSDLMKWCNSCVLQYLDLQIIAKSQSIKLSDIMCGDLIFRNEKIIIKDKMAQEVKPLSEFLLRQEILRSMHSQTYYDQAQKAKEHQVERAKKYEDGELSPRETISYLNLEKDYQNYLYEILEKNNITLFPFSFSEGPTNEEVERMREYVTGLEKHYPAEAYLRDHPIKK